MGCFLVGPIGLLFCFPFQFMVQVLPHTNTGITFLFVPFYLAISRNAWKLHLNRWATHICLGSLST